MDPIAATLTGLITSSIAFSPIEWAVHKELMHVQERDRSKDHLLKSLRARASEAHHDEHHKAFRGPEHYYRDITNEHVVVHFAHKDIAYILGSTAVVSSALSSAVNANLTGSYVPNIFYVAGSVAAAAAYYFAYEFTHHYMHVIGERRKNILAYFGTIAQNGNALPLEKDSKQENKSDGKLRFSKPLLDDICNEVEDWIDTRIKSKTDAPFAMPSQIQQRYVEQKERVRTSAVLDTIAASPHTLFDTLAQTIYAKEVEKRASLSPKETFKYGISRQIQRSLRRSPIFAKLDNHHFIHHYKWKTNLNVVAPLADYMFGTKVDSSRATLEATPAYWLCPNSIDAEPFKL